MIFVGISPTAAQPHLYSDDLSAPLLRGFEALRTGNHEAARQEFERVIAIDPHNSYALNNLGVLEERKGNLREAMAYLLAAETYAAEYTHKLDEICGAGGMCLAVAPSSQKSAKSNITSIIHSNINLLRVKISKAKSTG